MDLMKIGRFIAERRKKQNLTQLQLAERLGVTDRAISKWECGRSLPDASIMLALCEELGINVNELLTGEELEMNTYNEQAEKNLLEMTKQKEESDKRLLHAEIAIGITGTLFFFAMLGFGIYIIYKDESLMWLGIVLMVVGLLIFFGACFLALRIEQKAGYYECKHCHHRYVPTYKQMNLAPHMGRTRYMKCPKCGKKSWQRKVLSLNEEE